MKDGQCEYVICWISLSVIYLGADVGSHWPNSPNNRTYKRMYCSIKRNLFGFHYDGPNKKIILKVDVLHHSAPIILSSQPHYIFQCISLWSWKIRLPLNCPCTCNSWLITKWKAVYTCIIQWYVPSFYGFYSAWWTNCHGFRICPSGRWNFCKCQPHCSSFSMRALWKAFSVSPVTLPFISSYILNTFLDRRPANGDKPSSSPTR